jgi:integrase
VRNDKNGLKKDFIMASIAHQVHRCLEQVTLDEGEIERLKTALGGRSVKQALRPGGDPTKALPEIIGKGTRKTYFRTGRTFFEQAKKLTGEKQLGQLLTHEIILNTFDYHYASCAPGTAYRIQAAIKKIHAGALKLGWVQGKCPIENELRERDENHVRTHRYGYHPADAEKIVTHLAETHSPYALPAEIAFRCGLRENEIAGLKGGHVDRERCLLCFKGKGGRYREVPISGELLARLGETTGYYFNPKESWCANFRSAVQKAAKALGIEGSGVHRLRATFAQLEYIRLRLDGQDDESARHAVSKLLGHNRLDVTFAYIPRDFEWHDYAKFVSPSDRMSGGA